MAFKYGEKHEWELPHLRESYQVPDAGDLWSVKFYPYNKPGVDPIFAVVGGKHILICRVPQDSKGFEVIKSILDEEAEADHFACAWTKDLETGTPILCVAGHTGKILIIDALTGELQRVMEGPLMTSQSRQLTPKY
ncbi:hypothetical protein B0O99DRAFT_226374 [Bisporella sp. PMI_857]|nr:hypothetical protein B0O99DRAFT_226374 [Bisporella sp. PMI_857]